MFSLPHSTSRTQLPLLPLFPLHTLSMRSIHIFLLRGSLVPLLLVGSPELIILFRASGCSFFHWIIPHTFLKPRICMSLIPPPSWTFVSIQSEVTGQIWRTVTVGLHLSVQSTPTGLSSQGQGSLFLRFSLRFLHCPLLKVPLMFHGWPSLVQPTILRLSRRLSDYSVRVFRKLFKTEAPQTPTLPESHL